MTPLVTLLTAMLIVSACTAVPTRSREQRSLSRQHNPGTDLRRHSPHRSGQIVNTRPIAPGQLPPDLLPRGRRPGYGLQSPADWPAWIPYGHDYWGHKHWGHKYWGRKHHGHKHKWHKHHGHKHHGHKYYGPKYGPKYYGPAREDHGHSRQPRSLGHLWKKLGQIGRGIKDLVHSHHDHHKELPGYNPVYRQDGEDQNGAGTEQRHAWFDHGDETAGLYPGWYDPRDGASGPYPRRWDPRGGAAGYPGWYDQRNGTAGPYPGRWDPRGGAAGYPGWYDQRNGTAGSYPGRWDPRDGAAGRYPGWPDHRDGPYPDWPAWPATTASPTADASTPSPSPTTTPETTPPPATTDATTPPSSGHRGGGVLVVTIQPTVTLGRRRCPAGFTYNRPTGTCHERCPAGASYHSSACYCVRLGFAVDFVLWRCAPAGGATQ